ncbi:hypothetical protein RYX36_026447 [Vicia faba]
MARFVSQRLVLTPFSFKSVSQPPPQFRHIATSIQNSKTHKKFGKKRRHRNLALKCVCNAKRFRHCEFYAHRSSINITVEAIKHKGNEKWRFEAYNNADDQKAQNIDEDLQKI